MQILLLVSTYWIYYLLLNSIFKSSLGRYLTYTSLKSYNSIIWADRSTLKGPLQRRVQSAVINRRKSRHALDQCVFVWILTSAVLAKAVVTQRDRYLPSVASRYPLQSTTQTLLSPALRAHDRCCVPISLNLQSRLTANFTLGFFNISINSSFRWAEDRDRNFTL